MEVSDNQALRPETNLIKQTWWRRAITWEYSFLCLLVVLTLGFHFLTIMHPGEPLFDEQHYIGVGTDPANSKFIGDARSIIAGNGTLRPEHPPLSKLFISAGLKIFGDNPFGWRFPSVVFGTIAIVLFYLICRRLGMSRRTSNLATFLLAFDVMTFVQASVAMLDVFSLTFMMLAFWLYLRGNYELSALGIALSALAKLFGALTFLVIALHWAFKGGPKLRRFVLSAVLTGVFFFGLMPLFDYIIFPTWQNPISQTLTMLNLSSSLTFATVTHPALSRPWDWVLLPMIMPYWYNPNYTAAISFSIWGLIIPGMVHAAYRWRKGDHASLFALAWFTGTYLVWIPLSLITDRVSFLYYFYPTVGAVCIAIALGLSWLWNMKEKYWSWDKVRHEWSRKFRKPLRGAIVTYLAFHIVVFVLVSPAFSQWIILFKTY